MNNNLYIALNMSGYLATFGQTVGWCPTFLLFLGNTGSEHRAPLEVGPQNPGSLELLCVLCAST